MLARLKTVIEDRGRTILHQTTNRLIQAHERRLERHMAVNPLLGPPCRHFSQNDEDGITLRILKRIGALDRPGTFLEIGVGDGRENNTLVLLACGWSGCWLGNEALAFSIENSRVGYIRDTVTVENCVALAKRGLDGRSPTVASIDIDGNDYHVAAELLGVGLRPELFIVEYNAKFPPEVPFVLPYDPSHQWHDDDYYGASLRSWCDLFRDYRLVACNLTGSNAFFVRKEHADKFGDVPNDIATLFVPGIYYALPLSGQRTGLRTIEAIISP